MTSSLPSQKKVPERTEKIPVTCAVDIREGFERERNEFEGGGQWEGGRARSFVCIHSGNNATHRGVGLQRQFHHRLHRGHRLRGVGAHQVGDRRDQALAAVASLQEHAEGRVEQLAGLQSV
jgi:hypothetical protein